MIVSQEFIRQILNRANDIAIDEVLFSDAEPYPLEEIYIHPSERIFVVLSGEKRLKCASNGERHEIILHPGQWLVTKRSGWTVEHWDSPHEMMAVVFWGQLIRVIYINHDGIAPPPSRPDYFYHIHNALTPEVKFTLEALLAAGRDTPSVRLHLQALFSIIRDNLDADAEPLSRDDREWKMLEEILQFNFMFDLSCPELAAKARLHPVRFARLLKARTGMTINDYRNRLRMEYAASLLQNPEITVNEIARRCGFHYPNYFIRAFRNYYHCTPGEFRVAK